MDKHVVKASDEAFFTNAEGRKIFCKYFSETSDSLRPRALVFIAHGAAEHCLWYSQLAEELTQVGCYVFGHDHVGHGQSEGDRVHITDFKHYVRDVFQHTDMISQKFPNLPLFIIGHSMGGSIAILAALEKPSYFRGMVLIAPGVVAGPDVAGPVTIFLGRIVARICPQMPLKKLDTNAISRDPAVVQKYIDDPLIYHGGLKAKWAASLFDTFQYIQDHIKEVTLPFLTLHGDQDELIHVSGSELLAEQAESKDKMIKIYKGFYHQLHNEPGDEGKMVRDEISTWILDRIETKPLG